MKKIFSLFLFLGLAMLGFGQIAPTQPAQFPGPYVANTFYFQNANGKEVPYDIVTSPTGITYAVFDNTVTQVDLANALNAAQSHFAAGNVNSQKLIPLIVPGVVATGSNAYGVRTVADFTVTNAGSGSTLATIPAMQAWVSSSSTYAFHAVLYVNCGAGGSKVDFGGPASPTIAVGQVTAFGGAAVVYSSQQTSFLSGPAGSTSTAVTCITLDGTFTTNNGGIFVIQFAQSSANAAASTVRAGSTLQVTQLP